MMKTHCNSKKVEFTSLKNKKVVAGFEGKQITSDAGLLLIKQLDEKFRITEQVADCFFDCRDQNRVQHSVLQLIRQRIYGICSGYEDLNDHDQLRNDPLFSILVAKEDSTKKGASKSTLNRIELCPSDPQSILDGRYHKVSVMEKEMEWLFLSIFLQTTKRPTEPIFLDFDATDDPIHGNQEGKFFHGYYKCDCYLPLYVFCGHSLLFAKLRPSAIDAASGTIDILEQVVTQIRLKWDDIKIVIRGDGAFCRDEIMSWCEANQVDYVIGLPKNDRLLKKVETEQEEAKQRFEQTGEPARIFTGLLYKTLKTWSIERYVVAKAEHLSKGANPRFIVTSLIGDPQLLYEKNYCIRGDMENRIKEQQLDLFADRTSSKKMRANQLRLWMSSFAYVLLNLLRKYTLKDFPYCQTIRCKLLKIGGWIRSSCRRIYISLSESYAFKKLFLSVYERIEAIPSG